MARNYRREYKLYGGKAEHKKERALRNKARRVAIREGRASKGDGKDVHHRGGLKDSKNTTVVNRSSNRSFSRKGEKGHGPRKGK